LIATRRPESIATVLAWDRVGNASASAMFSSTQAGVAQIVATARQAAGVAPLIKVAGPPTLVPDGAGLVAGATLPVTVFDEGTFESCQATPAAGLHVKSGSQDLMAQPGGADQTHDGVVDLVVTVDAGLSATATTVISCRDVFGQTTTGTFTASP